MHLGVNLRELRMKKGMTQEQLSYALGVSAQSISRWENGSTFPDITMLPMIASYFDVSIDTLMGYAKACTREEREHFLQSLHGLSRHEQIEMYRQILDKYPNDTKLQFGLAGVLYGIWKREHSSDIERELYFLCHRILNSDDTGMQCGARRCFAFMAKKNGDMEQAMKYVNELPSILCSREIVAMQILEDISFQDAVGKYLNNCK